MKKADPYVFRIPFDRRHESFYERRMNMTFLKRMPLWICMLLLSANLVTLGCLLTEEESHEEWFARHQTQLLSLLQDENGGTSFRVYCSQTGKYLTPELFFERNDSAGRYAATRVIDLEDHTGFSAQLSVYGEEAVQLQIEMDDELICSRTLFPGDVYPIRLNVAGAEQMKIRVSSPVSRKRTSVVFSNACLHEWNVPLLTDAMLS